MFILSAQIDAVNGNSGDYPGGYAVTQKSPATDSSAARAQFANLSSQTQSMRSSNAEGDIESLKTQVVEHETQAKLDNEQADQLNQQADRDDSEGSQLIEQGQREHNQGMIKSGNNLRAKAAKGREKANKLKQKAIEEQGKADKLKVKIQQLEEEKKAKEAKDKEKSNSGGGGGGGTPVYWNPQDIAATNEMIRQSQKEIDAIIRDIQQQNSGSSGTAPSTNPDSTLRLA